MESLNKMTAGRGHYFEEQKWAKKRRQQEHFGFDPIVTQQQVNILGNNRIQREADQSDSKTSSADGLG